GPRLPAGPRGGRARGLLGQPLQQRARILRGLERRREDRDGVTAFQLRDEQRGGDAAGPVPLGGGREVLLRLEGEGRAGRRGAAGGLAELAQDRTARRRVLRERELAREQRGEVGAAALRVRDARVGAGPDRPRRVERRELLRLLPPRRPRVLVDR